MMGKVEIDKYRVEEILLYDNRDYKSKTSKRTKGCLVRGTVEQGDDTHIPRHSLPLYRATLTEHQKEREKTTVSIFNGDRKSISKDIGQKIF